MRGPRAVRFDDSFHSGIQALLIRQDGIGLQSIDIKYQDGNDISTWSEVHGCEENLDSPSIKTTMIKLDYPNEYLTTIYGHDEIPWSDLPWVTLICSISFKSNKRTLGPFGDPIGQFFADDMGGTMIVGFYGRSLPSYGLHRIWAHRKRLDSHQICPPKDLSPAPSCPTKDLSPAPSCPTKDLIPADDSLRTKLKKDRDDNTNEHSTCVVSNNQISKNHGDGNGSLSVGNKIFKYVQFGIFIGSNPQLFNYYL
ncbi:hypothetical protein M0R45_020484 [Rubus argutus]|uniref:Jacalin-type lectin domain-containing protein n=1 Tax=Rubus argutus TaxID=59490 RepID=A0AAW1XBP7_RUBAR